MEAPTPPPQVIPDSTALELVDQAVRDYADSTDGPLPAWRIDGLNTAEWAMRKLAHAQRLLADLQAQHDAWAEPIDAWLADAQRPLLRTVAYFTAQLERYALDQRAESGNETKNLTVPSGRVSTRATAPTVKIVDSEALLAQLDELSLAMRPDVVKREVRISELMKHCEIHDLVAMKIVDPDTGEISTVDTAQDQLAGAVEVEYLRQVVTFGSDRQVITGLMVQQPKLSAHVVPRA